MKRAGAGKLARRSGRAVNTAGRSASWRVASRAVLALSLLSLVGCTAGTGADAGADVRAGAGDGAADSETLSVPPAPAAGTTGQAAAAAAEARLEMALRGAYERGKPGAEQLRGALAAAGFEAGDVQVTASRTPTGLEADAVEVGVREGDRCLVAQIRSGEVHVTALPVLAGGLCLIGAAAP